ncbi:YraN family protein [Flavobacteriaceae bacterium D16]|nr:YraN family protein [Flavobacteriaceae bacterium D16]
MEDSYLLGRLGEETAARFLQQAGYQIIARNFRYLKAEIDLIVRKGDVLAIVEVKTRTGPALERMFEAVNRRKRARLIQAADHFITSNQLQVETRFDIIWITRMQGKLELEHIENAFYSF